MRTKDESSFFFAERRSTPDRLETSSPIAHALDAYSQICYGCAEKALRQAAQVPEQCPGLPSVYIIYTNDVIPRLLAQRHLQ